MVADLLFTNFAGMADQMTSDTIDRKLKASIRALVASPGPLLRGLENPRIADDASRASDVGLGRVRSPGTAAVGQLRLFFRFLSSMAAVVVIASVFSAAFSIGLFAISVLTRAIVRRQWMGLAARRDERESNRRRVVYWGDIAANRPAAEEIRIFGLSAWVVSKRESEVINWLADMWESSRSVLGRQNVTTLLTLAVGFCALAAPGIAAASGKLSIPDMVRCFVAVWGVTAIGSMGLEAFDIEYGIGAMHAYHRLSRSFGAGTVTTFDTTELAPGSSPTSRCPDISLTNVTFKYPTAERPALQGINIDIPSGGILGIVGENGAGKSTLIKLIAGLYQPDSGEITADGISQVDLGLPSWRRRVAVAFQDYNRYPVSLLENITLGAPEWGDDRAAVDDVLHAVGLEEMAQSLPNGLLTVLAAKNGEGVDLSGGQWQRIAIARALFAVRHERHLVIFDEPTAHVDVASEADFCDRIIRAADSATVIIISHRLSTVRHANRIVVLSGGRIVETGDHDSLLRRDGEYARMFRLQASRFLMPGPTAAVISDTAAAR
jgi:ATP-binding cassette, subfamily B, bacterial